LLKYNLGMIIDKELYRRAYEQLSQWNEEELKQRVRSTDQRSPSQAWKLYADLWALCMELSPPPSELQMKRRTEDWEGYYSRMRQFEEWRRGRGNGP
jgi:hypothetical protein